MEQVQELLHQLKDQKRALDCSSIVAATDARGVITYVNHKFCEISGYAPHELIGKTHKIVNSGHHPKEFFRDLWTKISAGQIWQGEICNRSKNGHIYWVQTTIVPFCNEDNIPIQFLSVRHEITALKEAYQTIQNQQSRLVAASKLSALGEMAATVTHEINNPLAVVLGRCEMLRSHFAHGERSFEYIQKQLDTIEYTARRIEKIVKSIRNLAHDSDEEPLTRVSLRSVLEETLVLCAQRFANHGINLRVENPYEHLMVETKGTFLLQILLNLLNNAHDAAVPSANKEVRLVVEKAPTGIEISIIDSGAGVPVALRKRIFDPFFTTKNLEYGTGLGLSVSSSMARQIHGELVLDESSQQTKFTLRLPYLDRVHPQSIHADSAGKLIISPDNSCSEDMKLETISPQPEAQSLN